jgi:N,N-dimethylformamidase
MLIGYVSDERYVALPDVLLEFEGKAGSIEARSRASGAVYADLKPGEYMLTLQKPGYGAKRVPLIAPLKSPYQFRLLTDGLLGYVWPKWVKSGEKSEFRVHSVEQYKLTLWRYGLEKEFVRPIGWYDEHGPRATLQITPNGDYTQGGAQWNKFGYTSPHHKQFIEAPSKSGLYYFHAQTMEAVGVRSAERGARSDTEFGFPWIVAPAQPAAKTAVLLANITWNAYNNFGGRSNYIHPDRLPPVPTVNARLELKRYTDPRHINYDTEDYAPLSFERPEPINHIPLAERVTDPIEGRAPCHIAPAEWRLLGWLEREGFAYDVYGETQLNFDQLPLDRYKVLILTAHPEYWSSKMYFALKRWVFERGGRLMYLGGNGLNCDVEFVDESTMIVRNTDTTHHVERKVASRFAARHESEARLLGVVYDDRGIMTSAPYEVVDADHWALAGTGLKKGDRFGQHSLHMRVPGGASGHETDKMSADSPANTRLLARGLNPDGGGAHMVVHEPSGGGAVFSAGSICWISSLLVDDGVSRITANVLTRFLG